MELGKIRSTEITKELSRSYLDYAMSVIVARALPDIRDGLKPVHRRILYAMAQEGHFYDKKYVKCAGVIGEVLKKYHPHGDSSVYDALVRLGQNWNLRYMLIDGQGNFGSVDGDPPAAYRYTECRLSKIASELLVDIEKDTVKFSDNFDATVQEPDYLPALLPNLLLMGSEGIAVGMATKIPPHNLGEVVDGVIATIEKGKAVIEDKELNEETEFYINRVEKIARGEAEAFSEAEMSMSKVNFESEVSIEELVKIIPGPDFPTGGSIYGASSMADLYATGRGKIVVRGIAEIKETKKGKSIIEITEIPYQVNKAQLVEKIADLVKDKKIKGIGGLRDESDRNGMSVVIELKRDGKPKSVLNALYKYTKLQSSFPANFVALVNGTPHTVNLKQILVEYVKHRQKVIVRRTVFELTNAKKRAHILEGLKIALDNLDEVIKTIRASKTQEEAKNNLMDKFGFTGIQATAILDMQLRRLAALERQKIEDEYNEIMKQIDKLISILKTPKKVLDIITGEIEGLKERFGDKRKTRIYQANLGEFSEEDLIPKTKTLVTVTRTGYVKRVDMSTYKSQKRGGKGVIGMTTKEEDEIEHLISATTHDDLLFFTNKGKVFGTKVWEIEESGRQAKGTALVNLINLDSGEEIRSIVPMGDDRANNLIMATRSGMIKKTAYTEFNNLRSNGLIAINLSTDDQLVSVRKTSGDDHVFLLSKEGKSIRFPEKNVRPMGRATSGVKGMSIGPKDQLISMETFGEKEEAEILLITEKGIGKRTKTSLFPVQKRAGKGVKAAALTSKTGLLATGTLVKPTMEQVIITSLHGQIIKLPLKNIPQMGRATQGVILMRFTGGDDGVAAVSALEKKEED